MHALHNSLPLLMLMQSQCLVWSGLILSGNSTTDATPNVYWLNNFETLYSSFGIIMTRHMTLHDHHMKSCHIVTLYELMVVNNWFIIMEGFVSTTSWAARIYFILFWITNTVSHMPHYNGVVIVVCPAV